MTAPRYRRGGGADVFHALIKSAAAACAFLLGAPAYGEVIIQSAASLVSLDVA